MVIYKDGVMERNKTILLEDEKGYELGVDGSLQKFSNR